jgi:hypothetical protein
MSANGTGDTPAAGTETEVVNAANSTDAGTSQVTATEQSTDGTAGSSPAKGGDGKTPPTMLDAVKAAIKGTGEQSSGSENQDATKDKSADPAKAGEEELPDEVSAEELARYNSKTRRRVKRLMEQKDTLTAEVGRLKPSAEKFAGLQKFMTEANLEIQEVNTGFELMRLMKNHPEEALAKLMPYVEALQGLVGEKLPADLQEQVKTGYITDQHAKELSRLRSRDALNRDAAARNAQVQTEREATEQRQTLAKDVGDAVSEWERKWSVSDPDYKLKQNRTLDKVKIALHEGPLPKNKAEAVALTDKCRKEVEKELQAFAPQRREVRTVTGGASSPSSTRQPQSMLDVVKNAVGAA